MLYLLLLIMFYYDPRVKANLKLKPNSFKEQENSA